MRPARVTHLAMAISAGFVLAAGVFAWYVSTPPMPKAPMTSATGETPAALFARRCARCHEAEVLAAALRGRTERDRARAELRAFLDGHGHATPEENRVLADFLVGGGAADGR